MYWSSHPKFIWKKVTYPSIFELSPDKIDSFRYSFIPLRFWTDESIYGALLIGFIAQVFVSLTRFEIPELKHTSTKFIKIALPKLTVTIDSWMRKTKKFIHSNFDAINTMILDHNWVVTWSFGRKNATCQKSFPDEILNNFDHESERSHWLYEVKVTNLGL